jgi:two-component system, response regulator
MKAKYILLIEDNPDDVLLTKRAFEKGNFANPIHVTADGSEAIDFLFAKGKFRDRDVLDVPALILLDLKLPKISGFEVLQMIRGNEATKLVPVVILTSSKEENDIVRGYELGANSYIQKPVNFDSFVETVKQLGFYWMLINEPPHTN